MKAGHSKLDGYSATLPAMRPSPRLPNFATTASTAVFFAFMRSYRRPSTHRRTSANTRSTRFKRVGQPPLSNRLRLVKSRMAPYHALSTCPLPCSEYLLNRLAAAHHLLHSLQSLPSSQHPQRLPSLGYPSLYILLVKLAKTLLLDAFKLSAMAVPYLLSFGWGQRYKIKCVSQEMV